MGNSDYQWRDLEAAASNPVWIDNREDLARVCAHWNTLPMIALDTEFQRVDTFYPVPGLIQVADDHACYLIDPLAFSEFEPLLEVFRNRSVLKILHAATEDLELFLNSLGEMPEPVFDTQQAAAFIGWGFSLGLQRLLAVSLNVELEKEETTSDWLKRPLTSSQERYAALDVAYLPALCQMQLERLQQLDRVAWVEEEAAALLETVVDRDPEGQQYFRRFSQAWKLPEYKKAALRDLTAWREQYCRKQDIPRNRLLRNSLLLEIVQLWPRTPGEMGRLKDMRRKVLKEHGAFIHQLLQDSARNALVDPPEDIQRPLHFVWNKRLKKLKAIGRSKAEELDIAPEVLLRKKDLDALIRSRDSEGNYQLPSAMRGWRQPLIGNALLEQLAYYEKHEQ